jgi:hypothetical protein
MMRSLWRNPVHQMIPVYKLCHIDSRICSLMDANAAASGITTHKKQAPHRRFASKAAQVHPPKPAPTTITSYEPFAIMFSFYHNQTMHRIRPLINHFVKINT